MGRAHLRKRLSLRAGAVSADLDPWYGQHVNNFILVNAPVHLFLFYIDKTVNIWYYLKYVHDQNISLPELCKLDIQVVTPSVVITTQIGNSKSAESGSKSTMIAECKRAAPVEERVRADHRAKKRMMMKEKRRSARL